MWESLNIDMPIVIDGMGIVFYSDKATEHIKEGEDYLSTKYSKPEQVAEHIRRGDIVGFCTGSSGDYMLKFRSGYPNTNLMEQYPVSARLAIVVDGGKISVIDLFWLMDWSTECPSEQQIEIEDGIYHITLLTKIPETEIWGDNQIIYVYLNRLDKMPELSWQGVPQLYQV
jgi:hypothetical protein